MDKTAIKTTKRIIPMIYCYSTPEIKRHEGWVKIGYTENDVDVRLKQQTHTADIEYKEEWRGNAIFEDGSGDTFKDTDFHLYLSRQKIERKPDTEWFLIEPEVSENQFYKFRKSRGILESLNDVIPYKLRDEQKDAVEKTYDYYKNSKGEEFLWNAKPRFGKTLTVYDFCKKIDAASILIVTNRPAIANSWYSDYERFLGTQSGYYFVSNVEEIKDKAYCYSREKYMECMTDDTKGYIEFVSLQDLKGSIYMGGMYDKLKEVVDTNWDLLVIDEAHEGVDTYKTDIAFEKIKRKFTLHLSGTPFKALANDKFEEKAIYNWTYADEQRAKAQWSGADENPYINLPMLNLFTYQMSEIVKDELKEGLEIDGEKRDFAFDLNEFFSVKENGEFKYESSVDKFLDALTQQEKFPFSTDELRNELKHTFWFLNRVDSAKALAKKLKEHPVFKEYEIVVAAGDGKSDDDDQNVNEKALARVKKAIKEYDKTITLSVGQLTTGVTVPEWTAVLMLSNVKSPSLYMQAAFRAQNPCLFKDKGNYLRKERAYVFDFDPARTLTVFEEFANDLSAETSRGRGDIDTRKNNIRELLNFFPVIGEDSEGKMVELDAEKVLSIPRKIHAQEVVKRGFMCDFLFQNVSRVFNASKEVIEIISQFTPVKEKDAKLNITPNMAEELSIDENGEVNVSDDIIIGKSQELLGEKIFKDAEIDNKLDEIYTKELKNASENKNTDEFKAVKDIFNKQIVAPLVDKAKSEISKNEKKQLESKLKDKAEKVVEMAYGKYKIEKNVLENKYKKDLENCTTKEEKAVVEQEFKNKNKEAAEKLTTELVKHKDVLIEEASKETVRTVETSKREKEKKEIESDVRDHLRGFSRTIPSFLMAYGNENVTLENFHSIIPENVFLEVTSITLEQFKTLRDEYNFFDSVVFNDSVKEFLNKKRELADYFKGNNEDIFDYIPPQKTNQIFTPKWVVKKMVDMLEEENPGCFDEPNKTFADLYMKSGLYIAEIVKRLFASKKMQALFPDDNERLKHIFEKQVYGLAPTEIIYNIAVNFVLGFDEKGLIEKHNFRLADALPYAKEGGLDKLVDRLYG